MAALNEDATIHAYSAYGAGGASTRVRLYDWFDHLRLSVVGHTYLGLKANSAKSMVRRPLGVAKAELALRRGRSRTTGRNDIVIISREASPLTSGSVEAGLLAKARRGVFDFDDAIWLPASGPRGWFDQERKARRAAEAADVVVVGNEVLADWVSTYAREVVVVPSCVEPSHYLAKTSWRIGSAPKMVWLGSPSTEKYVVDIAPALEEVWRRTGAQLTVISGSTQESRELDRWPAFVRRVAWTPEVARAELAEADVALAPLRDDAWARGKCAYKLLQYAASGLPIVGAPVGANARALERFRGVEASTDSEWIDGVIHVLEENEEDRARRGRAGIAAVTQHYSFASWATTWRNAVLGEAR